MKLFKKLLAVAFTLAIAAIPVYASAAAEVLDFEDGVIPAGIAMATNTDGTPDGDPAVLSVADFQGSKMLKVDPQQGAISKVKFTVADLVGEEKALDVKGLEYDLILENPDDTTKTDWCGGSVGGGPWASGGAWANGTEWTVQDDTKNISDVKHVAEAIPSDLGFVDTANAFFLFQYWGNNKNNNIYIDNIKLTDADGNVIPFAVEAAPAASDDGASVPKTGVVSLALLFGLGAAAMGSGSVVMKRKEK